MCSVKHEGSTRMTLFDAAEVQVSWVSNQLAKVGRRERDRQSLNCKAGGHSRIQVLFAAIGLGFALAL